MNMDSQEKQTYRENDVISGLLHFFGIGLAIAVLTVLVVLAAKYQDAWHIVGYSLYGSGLVLLYFFSAMYHLVPRQKMRIKNLLKRLDHAMIYIFIAATYTPITFIVLEGGWRWSLFGIIWGLAMFGFIIKIFGLKIPQGISVALYIGMGWLLVVAFSPLQEEMNGTLFWLIFSGGMAYTVGVIFFILDKILIPRKYFWMHEIFHLFVLAGSALHAIAMFFLL